MQPEKIIPLDLSRPSYRGAYHFARELAVAGRRKDADALFARLLWHVEASDGGFMGLDDAQLDAKIARDPRLNEDDVFAALYDAGQWPGSAAVGIALPDAVSA